MKRFQRWQQQGSAGAAFFSLHSAAGLTFIVYVLLGFILLAALYLLSKTAETKRLARKPEREFDHSRMEEYISTMDSTEIDGYLSSGSRPSNVSKSVLFFLFAPSIHADTGVLIMIILLLLPILAGIVVMALKLTKIARQYRSRNILQEAAQFDEYLSYTQPEEAAALMLERRRAMGFRLGNTELAGSTVAVDSKGLLYSISSEGSPLVIPVKKSAAKSPQIDPQLARLVLWFIGCAAFWLLFGTTIGEYVGIKFVAPDVDHAPWFSFGRLRPVHTNAVFWGWASLGMLGLGYYIVPKVSNTVLASIRMGWYSLIFMNAAVLLGSLCLMSGINNGGGEYREYIWPVMILFVIGLLLTLINYWRTVAKRTTHEIYISNWYIVSAVIFVLVISIIGYLPFWQDGLGETIIQAYWMHQAVGMWFMFFTLGIVYYFLPQQLNKPIYSYSLGVLAFWTQILFYTVIGTHHFIFSAIPWRLQVFAVIGSVGMIIPVTAGTTNFLMTFKGAWNKVASSYTLPFFLVGIVFYFTGSMQGTAEAFHSTNLIWHFTDFTVAHSHLTMYGIISFLLWAGMYSVIPRLTGVEPPHATVGAHFWLALSGLLIYTIPLMYGSTIKGMMWTEGKPFIDGVVFMAPYWLWRAIGGSLMWTAHLFFAYNIYRMVVDKQVSVIYKPAHGVL